MRATAVAGLTLSIFGLVLCLTGFGILFAPLLLLPGIFLCGIGLKAFTVDHRRTSPSLVVVLTLASLGLAASLVTIGVSAAVLLSERSAEESLPVDSAVLGEIFQAKAPLTQGDVHLLLSFGSLGTEWNRSTAPLIRDYINPEVTPAQWVANSKAALQKAREVYLQQQVALVTLEDEGAKATIRPIVEVTKELLDHYQLIQAAMMEEDLERAAILFDELRPIGLRKQEVSTPMVQRMRRLLGPEADVRLREMVKELSVEVSPK